jgi:hypothetical protein
MRVFGSMLLTRSTVIWLALALLLAAGTLWQEVLAPALAGRTHSTPYVRPEFARSMRELRPAILAAAARHNRPEISGMTDREFAVVVALLLYNEHFGWAEDALPPLRTFTPLYQAAQIEINRFGGNLSVWPSNLRPSVGLEILRAEVPVRGGVITRRVVVAGSRLNMAAAGNDRARNVAVTAEITTPELAVEYLAANLERGLYRAQHEGVPVTWRTLAAWHNQGIVDPSAIRANPTATHYLARTAAYLPVARELVYQTDTAEARTRRTPAV